MNEQLKTEGYYTTDLEFKMLGCAYWLDRGEYYPALNTLSKIHRDMETRTNITKIPVFANATDKLSFYLNLQDPQTGSFLKDNSYPLLSSIGVTANMLNFIEDLSKEAQVPCSLKYPLHFLDSINTPNKLTAFLNDLSTAGWIGAHFKSVYVEIGELHEFAVDLERLKLYSFSPDWNDTYLSWCYNNQDPATGFWGVRSRGDNRLLNGGDQTDSEKIIKMFVDISGRDIYPRYPLRYVQAMFTTALNKLSAPMPEEPEELHEWIINRDRGVRFLTRYLWNKADAENKHKAADLFGKFVSVRYEKFYIRSEGAFSLYPNASHADLDGTGEAIGMLDLTGALSQKKQTFLWGNFDKTANNYDSKILSVIAESDLHKINALPEVNSVRIYENFSSQNLLTGITLIYYPHSTKVLDVCDLMPKIIRWADTTKQNMGNWIWKESLFQISATNIRKNFVSIPVFQSPPLAEINKLLQTNKRIVLVGFDTLQVPRGIIRFDRLNN